jgi:hypothetical protein
VRKEVLTGGGAAAGRGGEGSEQWDKMRKAVQRDDLDYIKTNLETNQGMGPEDFFGWTILHFAADCDAIRVLLMLIDEKMMREEEMREEQQRGALHFDLEAEDRDLQTPMHVAAKVARSIRSKFGERIQSIRSEVLLSGNALEFPVDS